MTRRRTRRPRTPHYIFGLLRALAVMVALAATSAPARDVIVTIDDPVAEHVHAPGEVFTIDVSVSDPGIAEARLFAQWLAPDGTPLAPQVTLTPGATTPVTAPSTLPGHYDLRVWSDHHAVRFPPQDPGFHMDYGFAVMPPAQVEERALDDRSFFGLVHAKPTDPHLRGWIKTLTLRTASPENFARRIAEYQQRDRLQELPMVSGPLWDTDNAVPISDEQLDELGERFGQYLDALQREGVHVPAWQLGREENRDDRFELPHFFGNLERKAGRLRAELDQRGLGDVATVFSMRGFNYDLFTAFAASDAAHHFDVLGFHPYKWNDFPSPDTQGEWLRSHIETVARIMQDNDGPTRLWMTEFGIPHQGNNNPDGFYGYPASGAIVKGGDREHVARYIVKSHVVAMATGLVEKIFLYNYYDRGGDPSYAEDHFGLRMHAALTASQDDNRNGHTKPAYVAYTTMVRQLDDMNFVTASRIDGDVWVYEFVDEAPGESGRTLVAWTAPDTSRVVATAQLRPGLSASRIRTVKDLYGTPVELAGEEIALGPRPLYLRVAGEDPVQTPDPAPQPAPEISDESAGGGAAGPLCLALLALGSLVMRTHRVRRRRNGR